MVQGIFTGNSIAGAPVHNDGTSQMKGRKYIFNMHFFSYIYVILKVFDLQRCTIYQKFAFFMGVLLVPLDFM